MNHQRNRRSFLRTLSAGSAAGLVVDPRTVFGSGASDRVNIAVIGIGGRGRWFVDTMPQLANVVALCDVNDERAGDGFEKIPRAKKIRRLPSYAGGDGPTDRRRDHRHARPYTCGRCRDGDEAGQAHLLPEESFPEPPDVVAVLPQSPGHEQEWLAACRGGQPATSNFNYGGPLTEFLLTGNIFTQIEGDLEFDPLAGQFVNDDRANALLNREYRKGWTLK